MMLSNPLHRFSPYHNMPPTTLMSGNHLPQSHMHANGLESLGPASSYSLHQLQQHAGAASQHSMGHPHGLKSGRPHYGPGRLTGTSGPVRRRISRACDQCNQLRTKCDGQLPCAHCIEFGLGCEYIRERKKRGKASRKDLAQQAAAQAAAAAGSTPGGHQSDGASIDVAQGSEKQHDGLKGGKKSQQVADHALDDKGMGDMGDDPSRQSQDPEVMDTLGELTGPHLGPDSMVERGQLVNSSGLDLNGYGAMSQNYDRPVMENQMMNGHQQYESASGMTPYPDLPYGMRAQSPTNYSTGPAFRMGSSPLRTYHTGAGPASPGAWGVSMTSPSAQFQAHLAQNNPPPVNLRYPVLEPLLPHLGNIIPVSLACDLIDLYFSSSSSAQMHPMSPFVLGFVFRKQAFLHPTKPRRCQPALLASMLWVAAQTSDAPFMTSAPSARGKICQKLLELTVGLLKPLIHNPSSEASPAISPAGDGVSLGGLGVAMPGSMSMDALTGEFGPFGAAGNLDDVATYIHLATVVSASEYKGASLRWWNAAWSLARELKLGRELPPSRPPLQEDGSGIDEDGADENDVYRNTPDFVTEEEREERRRIWWLVYIVDRHLALCYNRPLFLLDIECDGLLQPMDDTTWQRGNFSSIIKTDPNVLGSVGDEARVDDGRPRGPRFECRGHSIFGYFLPLMTILGEVVDLHHARNHPRFGVSFRSACEWDMQAAEITKHLELYEQSLKRFEQKHLPKAPEEKAEGGLENGEHLGAMGDIGTPSVHSVHTNASSRLTESDIQTRIVLAYGTHVMHVLHILLAGKWDPINLIDDNDLWISTPGFLDATTHAVSAAEAISQILEFDPGLEFMPFFFGIYLLQGSFLLLLIADKLQLEASPSVVKACETIVRAHEACVVTLNTEYQRKFSKVMRSALAQVRGRVPEDLGEQHQRRRELLALYRWTGDGTGLAL
jgi:hypothetical protein